MVVCCSALALSCPLSGHSVRCGLLCIYTQHNQFHQGKKGSLLHRSEITIENGIANGFRVIFPNSSVQLNQIVSPSDGSGRCVYELRRKLQFLQFKKVIFYALFYRSNVETLNFIAMCSYTEWRVRV
jgi:hypothetical protein